MTYNKKIDYQFCKNIIVGNTEEEEQALKRVYYGKQKPKTISEFKLLECKAMFELLLSADDLIETLCDIHYSLYKSRLSEEEFKLVDSLFKLGKPDLIYRRLAETCLFDTRVDFLAFIYNAKRISQNLYPIIFYKESTRFMYGYFRIGCVDEGLEVLTKMKLQTEFQNQKHRIVNKEIVVREILKHKELLETRFLISKIYLFGSCSRDEMNEYSDIDMICVVSYHDSKRLAEEVSIIRIFLAELLDLPIDLKIGDDEHELYLNRNIKCDLYKVY